MKVLQVGLGNFGRNHLRAWREIGLGKDYYIAEADQAKWSLAVDAGVPESNLALDVSPFMDHVDVVDVVTPSTSHFELCSLALESGKDVFVEKPMTMTSREAQDLAALVEKNGRILQVGYYYRFHPISQYLKNLLSEKRLGDVRYISGNFMGFKRCRNDVGVTHTDGIHFIDLFNWFLGRSPVQVHAVIRDHFKRGLEDFSVVLMTYADGTVAKVESGYIQPGRWRDKVVPSAYTSKDIFICGSEMTVEGDYETERLSLHQVRHDLRQGTWALVHKGTSVPPVSTASSVEMVIAELRDFLDCVRTRRTPMANAHTSGVQLAYLMEGIYRSAKEGRCVDLEVVAA